MSNIPLKEKSNTSIRQEGKDTIIRYHNTDIVIFDDQRIIFNNGGWRTATTKQRMNQASSEFGLGFIVCQKSFNWVVSYKGIKIEFTSGMELKR